MKVRLTITDEGPTAGNNVLAAMAGFGVLITFGFIIYIYHVGQGATGRSWHSASLHCQALLFRPLRKHSRYRQYADKKYKSADNH
jgi:hypothetical protein